MAKPPTTPVKAAPKQTEIKRLSSSLDGDGFLTPSYEGVPLIVHGVEPVTRFDQKSKEKMTGYLMDVEMVETHERLKLTTYASVLVKTLNEAAETNFFPCLVTAVKPTGKRYYVFE